MKAYDFEYDGLFLSDFGFVICAFDRDSMDTIQNGSEITFNSVPTMNGMKHELTSSVYEDCITATFQICKNPCTFHTTEEISIEESREIMRWLNRKSYHKFRILDNEYAGFFFEASFNVSRIEMNGGIYGFELEMFTNRPFAVQDRVVVNLANMAKGESRTIISKSDEEGYIYPNMTITIESDGDLELRNSAENRAMKIIGCKAGEIISVNYPMISSSLSAHKVHNDFNWVFFRISTLFKNRENIITTSLPCSIQMEYNPVAKIGL